MSNPFVEGNRRIIERFGGDVVLTSPEGVAYPDLIGFFSNAENDAVIKGKNGGLSFKARGMVLKVMTEDWPEINNQWVIVIDGERYVSSKSLKKNGGMTLHTLAYYQESAAAESEAVSSKERGNYGGQWR